MTEHPRHSNIINNQHDVKKNVPRLLRNMSSDLEKARDITKRIKMKEYGKIIRHLYHKSIQASSRGEKTFRYIYHKLPVFADGTASIIKIRKYFDSLLGVRCDPIMCKNGREIGLLIYLT